jgi:hypothetical protein
MGLMEQISQMRQKGMNDNEISNKLQEQRVSPTTIKDAFNQLKVKGAVSSDDSFQQSYENQNKKSKMEDQSQYYQPRTQDVGQTQNYPAPPSPEQYSDPNQDYSQQNSQAPQEYYPQQYDYSNQYPQQGYGAATDTDTMIEIAEQVMSEKTKEMQKQIEQLSEFAKLAESRIENNNERIKRMEKLMDNLQIKILEKVGSYGDNLNSVKKEMNMMQESFSKMLPELAEAKKSENKTHHKKK